MPGWKTLYCLMNCARPETARRASIDLIRLIARDPPPEETGRTPSAEAALGEAGIAAADGP